MPGLMTRGRGGLCDRGETGEEKHGGCYGWEVQWVITTSNMWLEKGDSWNVELAMVVLRGRWLREFQLGQISWRPVGEAWHHGRYGFVCFGGVHLLWRM